MTDSGRMSLPADWTEPGSWFRSQGNSIITVKSRKHGIWCAWYEYSRLGHCGWGETEQEAIAELKREKTNG